MNYDQSITLKSTDLCRIFKRKCMPMQQLKELQFDQIFQNPIYERYAIKLKGSCCITGDKWGKKKIPKYEWSAGKQI